MCVRFCPVPITQSTFFVAGSYLPMTLAPSAVNQVSPATKVEAVGAVQWAEVDWRQRLLRDEIDDREGVVASAAVIGDVGGFAVGGGDDFVGVLEDGDFRDHLQCGGVDDGERPIALGEREERGVWGGLGAGEGNNDCEGAAVEGD